MKISLRHTSRARVVLLVSAVVAVASGALAVYITSVFSDRASTDEGATIPNSNYIASWDGTAWALLGSGMGGGLTMTTKNGLVDYGTKIGALTEYEGKLIAGGAFISAGGTCANNISSWDGSNWTPLGQGVSGGVYALTVYNGKLIVGGNFTTAGETTANHIASWDGSNWTPLGQGVDGYVKTLTVYAGQLIAGGYFRAAGGSNVNFIAAWNGESWSPLGKGMKSAGWKNSSGRGPVNAMTILNGKLVVGGEFDCAGDTEANYIASWDGTAWSPLGSGMSAGPLLLTKTLIGMSESVDALTVYNGGLIAGGNFTIAGGSEAIYIASWNGTSWSRLGSGIIGHATPVKAMTVYNSKLIAASPFDSSGTSVMALWDGSEWSPLGPKMPWAVLALTVYDGKLIVGGDLVRFRR